MNSQFQRMGRIPTVQHPLERKVTMAKVIQPKFMKVSPLNQLVWCVRRSYGAIIKGWGI